MHYIKKVDQSKTTFRLKSDQNKIIIRLKLVPPFALYKESRSKYDNIKIEVRSK